MSINHPETVLIGLPYAGGSTNCFEPLRQYLPANIRLQEVTLPGRGLRFGETLVTNLEVLAGDIWHQAKDKLRHPFALLGHSMGATLAYLLCHKIRQAGLQPPLHVFLSGREAPSVPPKEPLEHLLPEPDFKAKLAEYGGIAREILQEDVFTFFEPMIRADFQAVETWEYHPRPKLNIPATVFSGTEEDMTEEEVRAWQAEFSTKVRFEVFEGGHFFIFEKAQAIARIIASQLQTEETPVMSH